MESRKPNNAHGIYGENLNRLKQDLVNSKEALIDRTLLIQNDVLRYGNQLAKTLEFSKPADFHFLLNMDKERFPVLSEPLDNSIDELFNHLKDFQKELDSIDRKDLSLTSKELLEKLEFITSEYSYRIRVLNLKMKLEKSGIDITRYMKEE